MIWFECSKRMPGAGVRVVVWAEGHLPAFAHVDEHGFWRLPTQWPTHWARVQPPLRLAA